MATATNFAPQLLTSTVTATKNGLMYTYTNPHTFTQHISHCIWILEKLNSINIFIVYKILIVCHVKNTRVLRLCGTLHPASSASATHIRARRHCPVCVYVCKIIGAVNRSAPHVTHLTCTSYVTSSSPVVSLGMHLH